MQKSITILGLALLLAIAVWGALVYMGKLQLPAFLGGKGASEVNKYAGKDALSLDPAIARSEDYLAAGNVEAAVNELRSIQNKYAVGTDSRNVVDYSIGLYYAFSSTPEKAIDTFKAIVVDRTSYSNVTRAFAIEGMSRIYFSTHNLALLDRVFSGDPYFVEILEDAEGDKERALYELLKRGFAISPTPVTSVRLAAKTSLDILHNKATFSESERAERMRSFNNFMSVGYAEAQKMNSIEGYGPYLAEFYSSYAGAAQTLLFGKIPSQYSSNDVEDAYQRAYALSNEAGKAFILFRAASFLSIFSPDTSSVRIKELTGRLIALPSSSRALFDRFILNTYKNGESDVAYSLFPPYRKASPEFDKYVKDLVGR
ncbi:MAG: hypothetical protein EPO65_13980 [Dehalococcoidia bacterium]|nr:MAG: hypothetical protein EPO65_13980 [Dehalococcoidia bacterium]